MTGGSMRMAAAIAESERHKQAIVSDPNEARRAARIWLQANGTNETKLVEAVALLLQQAAGAQR